ncbi:SDR family oxidoreductase [Patescibacteria group bacterium]|nr:SDR family oxidoreductase [Patescibacteria group bacterium]
MKTVLLTGAGGGIGSAIASSMTGDGYEVVTIDRNDADLSSYEDIQKLAEKFSAEGKTFDWVVCAHGFIDGVTEPEQQDPEMIVKNFEVNTFSLFYISKLFLPLLTEDGGMIFISSTSGIQANGRFLAYSASKAAVNSLAQGLARNKPEHQFFSLCPGPTNTSMRERIAGDATKMQSPDVIAKTVLDLINQNGDFKSGDIISVRDEQVAIVSKI